MKRIQIYTDGSCSPNPGVGGWAYIIRYPSETEIIGYGYELGSTNNRMEIMAVIKALEYLNRPSFIELTLDSQYVGYGMIRWMHGWAKTGFNNKNGDLWKVLYNLYKYHKNIDVNMIKGHSDCLDNNRCDKLAVKARKERISNV
jgi:ribonuclease HI